MAAGSGLVKQIVSGDTLVLLGNARPGAPPPERTLTLASVSAPRMAIRTQSYETKDEPFGFESREFLRKLIIGRSVEFSVIYEYGGREQSTIKFGNQDVGLTLVAEGLARVRGGRPPQCSPIIDEMRQAEEAAKLAKKNIWSDSPQVLQSTIRDIRWMIGDGAGVQKFVNENRGQKISAIIEFIRDGGCYRAYFPEHRIFANVLLSGVQVDAFRRVEGFDEPQPDPFASEAKHFVEVRVLHRDVEVRLEGADDYGNILGSILHPRGNVAVLLLLNGFAETREWSLRLTENPAELREAQKQAQSKKLRKWRGYIAPASSPTSSKKMYPAKVIEVVSGDCFIVLPLTASSTPEGEALGEEEKRLYLGSLRCARVGSRQRPDEPWAYEAKEFVRKAIIGKRVVVNTEYIRDPSNQPGGAGVMTGPIPTDSSRKVHYVSILYDNKKKNLSEELIRQGLARTLASRSEETRVANFDDLLQLEKEAAAKRIGLHRSNEDYAPVRLNDLCGPENRQKALQFAESLKRAGKLDGIIEYIFSGSRYRIRIPSESIAISFSLARVRCPATARIQQGKIVQPAEDFAAEALRFARENYMQRLVTISIEASDRGGNFIGWMTHQKENVNLHLVELGLARVSEGPGSTRDTTLVNAEISARQQRLGMWMNADIDEDEERSSQGGGSAEISDPQLAGLVAKGSGASPSVVSVGVLRSVVVVQSTSVESFYIQDSDTRAVEQLQSIIAEHIETLTGVKELESRYTISNPPRRNEVVLAKYSEDQKYYRAKVEVIDKKNQSLVVLYIDFGNRASVSIDEVFKCPSTLSPPKVAPCARHCLLAGLKEPPEFTAEGAEAFYYATVDNVYCCLVEYIEPDTKKYHVYLYKIANPTTTASTAEDESTDTVNLPTELDQKSVNEEMLLEGYAVVNKKAKTDVSKLLQAQQIARKEHKNVWRHGDIDDDPDPEL